MNNTNKINEITKRLSEISLNISRVPSNTKREFISLANAGFCGDYGMLLKTLLDSFFEYNSMKALFFDKLENMENKIDSLINKQEQKKPKVRTFGRIESKKEGEE